MPRRDRTEASAPCRSMHGLAFCLAALLVALGAGCARPPSAEEANERPALDLAFDAPEAAPSGEETVKQDLSGTVTFDGIASPVEVVRRAGSATRGSVLDVELKKKRRLFGMRGFRLRPDAPTVAADTALVYAHLRHEGVLAPRVEWVSLSIDGIARPSGFLEEVVAKELLEAQRRREGVTFGLRGSALPVVKIHVDDDEMLEEEGGFAAQHDTAAGLLRAFLEGALAGGEVFDVDLTARFLCIAELWGAPELLRAENLHFYFNPLTQRIEPIADAGPGGVVLQGSTAAVLDQPWPAHLLRDPDLAAAFRREATRLADGIAADPQPEWWLGATAAGATSEDATLASRSVRLRDAASRRGGDAAGPVVVLRGDPDAPRRERNPIPTIDVDGALARHPFLERVEGEARLRVKRATWKVEEPLVVPPGVGLDIGDGTTLRFAPGAFVLATGPLRWRGSADAPIVLEALPGAAEGSTWQGVVVLRSDEPHHWAHVEVRETSGISFGDWHVASGVTFRASDVRIEDGTIRDNRTEDALNLIRSRFQFRNVSILETISDAFDCDHCDGSFEGGFVRDVGGDGIDVSGSRVSVASVRFESIRDKAISVGEESRLEARGVRIANVGTAIASKDGSSATIEEATIDGVEHVAVMAYRKKSAYGPARVDARNLTLTRVGRTASAQVGSTVVIDGVRQPEEPIDVDELYDDGYMKK